MDEKYDFSINRICAHMWIGLKHIIFFLLQFLILYGENVCKLADPFGKEMFGKIFKWPQKKY